MRTAHAGDSDFTIKYNLYSDMIYKMSLLYLNNSIDCEDIIQEVFIKLFLKGLDFKDQEHEKRWLLRITVNCCIDKIRTVKNQGTLPLDENIFITDSREDKELAEMVFQLSQNVKAPIHLYYYEGYKVAEIAKILGISSSAVKMRLKRGREMLKIQLEEE